MDYDHESNLISVEITNGKIDHVLEVGNFLIHVNKNNTPLLIEILNGGKFISQLQTINKKEILKSVAAATN